MNNYWADYICDKVNYDEEEIKEIIKELINIVFSETTKIIIPLNDEYDIIAEHASYQSEKSKKKKHEIYIYLQSQIDCIYQDIAIIRPSKDKQKTEILVYGNCDDEDYTEKYEIGIWEGEN